MTPAEKVLHERVEVVRVLHVHEEGRGVRAIVKCPYCGTDQKATACSDVGGVWVYCEKCGTNPF